ncbi:MAG TPA: fused MFS/spermidine synthase [Vicinamibacterales bacterium]
MIWLSCLLAFISSFCTLVIELIAGRIMAPYIGVSLYTWTSIIGIVLAGMSAGNFFGGYVADRFASRRTLGLIFIAGSIATLSILVVTSAINGMTFGLSFLPRIVLSIALIFFVPSFVLGMVSPFVVKLALDNLERSGHTVGTIYAASTVGSIVGTFATGFWLISWLGTRTIVWIVAATLLVTGLLMAGVPAGKKARAAVTAAALAALIGLRYEAQGRYDAPCDIESNYYCIKVLETFERGHPARMLMLDRLIHSYIVPDDPTALDYGYEQAYSNLTHVHADGRPQIDTLFIGGGGYSFPRYIEAVYPTSTVDVIEIDPAVIAVAYDRLGLPASSRIRSFNRDARVFLTEWTDPKRYDLVYGDAFNDLSIPYHLTTVEFNRIVASRLKPDGVYLTNIIDKFDGGEFLKAEVNALRAAFPHVYVFGRGDRFAPFDRNTYVVMASQQPLDRAAFDAVTSRDDESVRTTMLPQGRLDVYLTSGRAITLTDDFVPVDQLLANLFIERGN